MVDGLKSAGSLLTGAGLVLIPIAGLAGFLLYNWPKIKDFLPDSELDFLSPEWLASWGDDPEEITAEKTSTPNTEVDKVVGVEGKTPYQAYSIGAAGRYQEWENNKNNAVSNHAAIHGIGILPNSIEAQQIMAEWLRLNPEPPRPLLANEADYQVNIRETAHRRTLTISVNWFFPYLTGDAANYYLNAEDAEGYVDDILLDWLWAVTFPREHKGATATRIKQAEYVIENHALA